MESKPSFPRHWVQVVGQEQVTKERVVSQETKSVGRKKVTRKVVEIVEEPYVLLSCGHRERAIDFDAMGGGRKRMKVDCWKCGVEARKANPEDPLHQVLGGFDLGD